MHFGVPFTIIFFVNRLSRFEKLVEQLVETPFARLFKSRLHPADLAKGLAWAMEQGAAADANGNVVVPDSYMVYLHPADLAVLRAQSDLTAEIAAIKRYLLALMRETGSKTTVPLHVTIAERETLTPGTMDITADRQLPPEPIGGDTKRFQPSLAPANCWWLRLPETSVRLGMPIVRIGRDGTNDVVLAHPTVSRHHAQLRWQNGIYFVENLSHRQPLGVNFKPADTRTPLKAGDTLQLGQVTISVEIQL